MIPAAWTMVRLPALALLLVGVAAGCSDITFGGERGSPCGPETRTTSAKGTVADATQSTLASAALTLVETRDANPASLFLLVSGQSPAVPGPLREHVLRVRVATLDGATVFRPDTISQTPASTGGGLLVSYLKTTLADPLTVESLRQRFISNTLLVELETDYPSANHLRLPLTLDQASDVARMRCL